MRSGMTLLVVVLAVLGWGTGVPSVAQEDDFRNVAKDLKKSFRPLDLPSPAQMAKDLRGRLPEGIVTESAPFDALIDRLTKPHAAQLADRTQTLVRLILHASPEAARLMVAAFRTIEKERVALAKRVREVEAAYAEVFNVGYMEASMGDRRTRKAAAVLIPFYRRLLLQDADLVGAAADVLGRMASEEGVEWLVTKGLSGTPEPFRAAVVVALGRIGGEAALEGLRSVRRGDRSSTLRSRALATLFLWKTDLIRDDLILALDDPAWEVRALAIAACRRAKLVDAVEALIERLAHEDGRLRTDIDDALSALVGTRLYADVDLWRTWWQEHEEDVRATARELRAAGAYDKPLGPVESWIDADDDKASAHEAERRGTTTAFYGIETRSKRVIFVVDISFSMDQSAGSSAAGGMGGSAPHGGSRGADTKMAAAKKQLRAALESLPSDARCNLVVYSESYVVWAEAMAFLKRRSRKRLGAFIGRVKPNGTTNICDALDRALELAGASPLGLPGKATELEADTLFLLSDGAPNRGRLARSTELLEDFWRRTARSRIVVHTIGIGEAAGSTFLRELARRTGGRYVGVR